MCSALVELSDGDALRLAFEPTDHALVVVGTTTAAPGGSLDDERLSLSRQILWTTGRVPRALGWIAAAVVFTVAGVTSSLLAGPALSGNKGMPGPGWLALVLLLRSAG